MSNFVQNFGRMANQTLSENQGIVYKSTGEGALLDLFALIGGMRHQPDNEIIGKWKAAYKENPELASNLILYTRNCRNGGLGERRIGRLLLKELAMIEPEKVKRNFQTIVDTGRFDDLYVLEGTPCESEMWEFVKNTFVLDVTLMKENKPISLLAKWMPSINTSSKESRRLANKFCNITGLSPRTYRKALSKLRAYIDVVERKMSAGEWDKINYEAVPSLAMSRYTKTFNTHDYEGFSEYKEKLSKGEAKVNASVITPSEICKKYLVNRHLDNIDKEQWKALPNYVQEGQEVVCVADVSGSMSCCNWEPMAASIGLATYFAQKNQSAYHNLYMTFTNKPHFIKIEDTWDIEKCFQYVEHAGVGYNTNADRMMEAIYNLAVESNEAPKAVIVISDGEFDSFCRDSYLDSLVSKWNKKFIAAGLNPVRVISWNVAARNGTVIAPATDNVAFCSGSGAGVFKNLTSLISKTAYEAMVEILTKPEFTWK